ncbi:MAG: RDD family protein [Candidatus Izemoplasmatales bacterium]|jgi:hypothetical protein|nr:RDD family protein [Candidatus Izemoplasmatales bacterium]
MSAGFFRRAFSSLADILIVILIVYATFLLFGRSILRNQIDHFDQMYTEYSEILEAYNQDLSDAGESYKNELTLASGDDAKEAVALKAYQTKLVLLDQQNTIDIEPFNRDLTRYFLSVVYYFALGFLILTTIYTLAMKGRTLGRRIMQVKLDGPVHVISVFFHDVVFKYFFIVIVFMISMGAGITLFLISVLIDVLLISVSRRRATLRDILLKMSVVRTGYGYK